MKLSLSGLFGGRRTEKRRTTPRESFFRPSLEVLEGRIVPSAMPILSAPSLGPAVTPTAAPTASGQQLVNQAMNLNITGVTAQNGQLIVSGTVGGAPIPPGTALTLSSSPNAADPTCPILNLHLDAIHLNLLGLNVDTSPICLSITAHSGGGVLGDLLCSVSNLLNNGTPLSSILGGLTSINPTALTSGLTSLFTGTATSGGLNSQLANAAASSTSTSSGGTCNILNLSLGPVDLNLLGLEVTLNNCNTQNPGPVTVAVTAQSGSGQLLGNLLCDVTHLLDNTSASTSDIAALLNTVESIIGLPPTGLL